ncbi:uncharacterized protein LOC111116058 isoform X3 [Crassostrea virginica]
MNFPAATFLVLMVSTCVMSHFHTGQAPVGREEMMNLLQRNMVPRGHSAREEMMNLLQRNMVPRGRSGFRMSSNRVYPGLGRGNAQTGMNNMQMRGMLPWMMAGGDAMDAMEDMMPMMMLQRMYQ